ncbi:hypothetical protein HNR68_003580 [Saccharopolyspora hordei]|uniref:Uncharacterized protein n=1 Tax=Saccharopolyspora hordei TaxID=1838 RepID=A0A853ASC4_9PSEU|nr:hypothetical protein [Saccharopolyspora hordei]
MVALHLRSVEQDEPIGPLTDGMATHRHAQ